MQKHLIWFFKKLIDLFCSCCYRTSNKTMQSTHTDGESNVVIFSDMINLNIFGIIQST